MTLEIHHLLLRLTFDVVAADLRISDVSLAYKKAFASCFSEHRLDGLEHPVLYFTAFTVRQFADPSTFRRVCRSFYRLTGRFDSGRATPLATLEMLNQCKRNLSKFAALYLAVYPESRQSFLQDFFGWFKTDEAPAVGMTLLNEIIRRASYIVKGLKMQHYIEFYSKIKSDSLQYNSEWRT